MIVSIAPQRPTVNSRTAGLAALLACAALSAVLWSAGRPPPPASGAEVSSVAFGP